MKSLKINNVNIFAKLMIVSFLLVIIPVTVSSILGIITFSNSVEKETITSLQSSASNKLDLLQGIIEGVKRQAYASAHDTNAIDVLTMINNRGSLAKGNEINLKKQAVGDYLKDLNEQSEGMFESLFFTDSKGVVIADALDGKAIGVDISDRDYFLSASESEEIVVSDVVISAASGNPIMVIAAPLYNNDKFIGIFGMPIDFNKLTELLTRRIDGVNYNYTIFNSEGIVIAHEQKDMIFKVSMTTGSESQKALFKKMSKGEASYGFYDLNGVKKVMAYAPYKDKNWYVTTSCTVSDYMRPINTFKLIICVVALFCVIIALIFVFLFSRSISNPLKHLSQVAEAISSGDLTQNIRILKSKDEIGRLSVDFANMLHNLVTLISAVRDMSTNTAASSEEMMASSEEVSKVSEQIAEAVNELAKGASEQAVSTEKSNGKIVEIVSGLNDIAREMLESEELTEQAKETVKTGKTSVQYQLVKMNENKEVAASVTDAVGALSEKSVEIGEILSVIKGISDQTNLLSLNAAIEAARAGELGRGFAVVADEIGKLAEQSSGSVKKIDSIIREVQSGVEHAVAEMARAKGVVEDQEKALDDTVNSFKNIEEVVADINTNIKKVAKLSNVLDSRAKEAGDAISEIASLSEETASSTEEVAASTEEQTSVIHQIAGTAESLSKLANDLQKSITKFTI